MAQATKLLEQIAESRELRAENREQRTESSFVSLDIYD